MSLLQLEVITPHNLIYSGQVESVTLPAIQGEMCVLPGHAAFISSLNYGVLTYKSDGQEKKIAVHLGFFSVNNDTVTVMADRGESADSIDIERAKNAEKRAREKLEKIRSDEELEKSQKTLEAKLWRALTRQSAR